MSLLMCTEIFKIPNCYFYHCGVYQQLLLIKMITILVYALHHHQVNSFLLFVHFVWLIFNTSQIHKIISCLFNIHLLRVHLILRYWWCPHSTPRTIGRETSLFFIVFWVTLFIIKGEIRLRRTMNVHAY